MEVDPIPRMVRHYTAEKHAIINMVSGSPSYTIRLSVRSIEQGQEPEVFKNGMLA